MRQRQSRKTRRLQRRPPARVPRRKTDERIDDAQRNRQRRRPRPTQPAQRRQQIKQDRARRNPGENVKPESPQLAKNRMHKALVPDFNSAEHCDAPDDQRLRRLRRVRLNVAGLVLIGSKNSHSFHRHQPGVRHPDFSAAEDRAGSRVPPDRRRCPRFGSQSCIPRRPRTGCRP